MKLWMMEVKTMPKPKMRWKLRRSRAVMNDGIKMKPTDGTVMNKTKPNDKIKPSRKPKPKMN